MVTVITIDGPAGSGKSTYSRLLAKNLKYVYLDTGAMYRAVALEASRKGIDHDKGEALKNLCREMDLHFREDGDTQKLFLGEEDISLEIRRPLIDLLSSRISAIREVRDAMTESQRKIGRRGRIVAEGRDMGTVVFPDADHKFFVTADLGIRAERRYRERVGRGEDVSRLEVEKELEQRDVQDMTRAIAPLRPAKDAVIIDTGALSPEQVVEEILLRIKKGGG